jgi:hypothetical protein
MQAQAAGAITPGMQPNTSGAASEVVRGQGPACRSFDVIYASAGKPALATGLRVEVVGDGIDHRQRIGGSRDANSADGADLVHQDEDIVHQHEIVQFKLRP